MHAQLSKRDEEQATDCSLSADLINQMRSSAIALFSALITTFEVAKVNITSRGGMMLCCSVKANFV